MRHEVATKEEKAQIYQAFGECRPELVRLRKLARHLMEGERIHKHFDISIVSGTNFKGETCGCAIGEFPRVWPTRFRMQNKAIKLLDGEDPAETKKIKLQIRQDYKRFSSDWKSQGMGLGSAWLGLSWRLSSFLFTFDAKHPCSFLMKEIKRSDAMSPIVAELLDRFPTLHGGTTADDVASNINLFCLWWEQRGFEFGRADNTSQETY